VSGSQSQDYFFCGGDDERLAGYIR
jgi:hypothetical protein